MIHRMMNPKRVSMLLASVKRTINTQDFIPLRNAYPPITQANRLLQGFQPRDYSSGSAAKAAAKAQLEEVAETNQICKILKGKEWCKEIEEKLNGISEITDDDVIIALRTLSNPEKALSLFSWYAKHPSYKPSSAVYNALLKAVGHTKSIEDFWKYAEEMKVHGFEMEQLTYYSVFKRLARFGTSEQIAKLFTWMTENGEIKPGAFYCYKVLQSIANFTDTDIDAATRVVEAFKSGGGTMDKIIYDGFLRCLWKVGRFEEGMGYMERMAKEGYPPDNISYGQLIYGLCSAGRLEDARKLVEEMPEKGCVPDSITWSILIKGHCSAKETDHALALYGDMAAKGCEIQHGMFHAIANHLCSVDRGMEAYELVCKAVEENRTEPSAGIYSRVITKLCEAGMLKEACKMFELGISHGRTPTAKPIYALFAKSGTVADAYDFIHKDDEDISRRACFTMAKEFCNAGRESEAQDLISRLPSEVGKKDLLSTLKGPKSDKPKSKEGTKSDKPKSEDGADASKSSKKKRPRKRKAKKNGSAEKVASKDEKKDNDASKDESKEVESLDSKVKECT